MVTVTESTQEVNRKHTGSKQEGLILFFLVLRPPAIVGGTQGDIGNAEMLFVRSQPQHLKAKYIEG